MVDTGPQVAAYEAASNAGAPSTPSKPAAYRVLEDDPHQRVFYYFALPPAVAGDTVISAKLRVYQRGAASGGSRTLTVQRTSSVWSSSKVTHLRQPTVAGATATCVLGDGGTTGRLWEFDVTALIQEVANGAVWYGLRLTSDLGTPLAIQGLAGTSIYRPTLQVEYAPNVEPPTQLRPDHGNAVSIARPTFQWTPIVDALDSYQFQISTASDFSTFVGGEDSGQVFSTDPEHTIGFDLTAGTTYYWRVKVWNSAGVESQYSATAEFTRTAKPTLTIDNPAAPASNFVTEATPPFAWTVTGGTQVKFQVQVWNGTTLLHDSLERNGADVAYTPTADLLLNTTDTYRLVVRIWDDVARQSTPGDPPYVEAEREFTFVPQATVTPVATLVAASGVSPWPELTVTRATAPDYFQVFSAGVPVSGLIEPADVFVSGTTYTITVRSLDPFTTYPLLSVVAIVNGVTSSANPTVSVRTEPEGIWLCDEDGNNPVCISSDANTGTWSTSETSAVHQPIGSPYSVVIWQSKGARNGVVNGFFVDEQPGLEDVDIDEWKARFTALTEPPGQKLILSLTDTTLPVYVRVPLLSPASEEGDVPVSFEAYERPA
jgi:hypothetical protein